MSSHVSYSLIAINEQIRYLSHVLERRLVMLREDLSRRRQAPLALGGYPYGHEPSYFEGLR